MDFNVLTTTIEQAHSALQQSASKAVNVHLTLRNWLTGFFIVEYEQHGSDRAEYGKKLLETLAKKISIKGLTAPELSRCRQFYQVYPQFLHLILPPGHGTTNNRQQTPDGTHHFIFGTVSQKIQNLLPGKILGTLSQNSEVSDQSINIKYFEKLFLSTPYSHLTELIKIEDVNKRRFYEMLVLKTTPSYRDFKRQINTLSYERLGLSKSKDVAFEQLQNKIIPATGYDLYKSHYFLDFLGFGNPGLIEESELEQAILSHLKEFILELGHGFCFEARQKRILIGDEYFFIDLVFYHRMLKCHVLIDLKVDEFKHADASQLNTYLNYYKSEIMMPDDNPPVGILLVTDKNDALVKYATSGIDNALLISKYLLQLPSKKQLEDFIRKELKNL